MGRKRIYDEQYYEDLVTLDIEELYKKYPLEDRNKLRASRRYHRSKMEKEPTRRIVSESEYPAWIKNSEGEIETRDLVSRKYEYIYEPEDLADQMFPQVESSIIRPTKRKRQEAGYEEILGYGDAQVGFRLIRDPRTTETKVVPLHNVEMLRIILQMNAYYMPHQTINGSDMADFSGSSRFPADSDHFNGSLTLEMQWVHDFYSQLIADNPNEKFGGDAKHRETSSNHTDRPKKKVLREMPEMYNFYRPGEDYPAWTYVSMARLQELGIDVKSGYPNGEILTGEEGYPQVVWKHGNITGKNAVYREADLNPTVNIIRWHNHGERMIKRTTREGWQLFYLILGSTCLNGSSVPGYASSVDDFNQPVQYHNQDHVNSFVIHRDYGGGRYENRTIDVVDGKAFYDGMWWDGSEPYEWEYKYGYVKKEKTNE